MPLNNPPRRKHAGFSLIESLVALVVLATGMLGIAALYVESLRSAHTAHARTKAINLAADMADRIRANRAGRAAYAAGTADAGAQPLVCGTTVASVAQNCDAQQMAAFDIWLWKTMIGNTSDATFQKMGLPNGVGEIIIDTSTQPNSFTIRVSWSEKNEVLNYELAMVI